MDSVVIQVELPQYSQSFSVKVALESSILDVKKRIADACPGQPRTEGQRLIAKGRVLNDTEMVKDLWTVGCCGIPSMLMLTMLPVLSVSGRAMHRSLGSQSLGMVEYATRLAGNWSWSFRYEYGYTYDIGFDCSRV